MHKTQSKPFVTYPHGRGDHAEKLFVKIAKNRGWGVVPATQSEDMREHWDFMIVKDSQRVKVDVKSQKKIHKRDFEPSDTYTFVELKNVNGRQGWLYGKADMIAFEFEGYFINVPRARLVKWIDENVNDKFFSEPMPYYKFSRATRDDVLVLVPIEDLIELCCEYWEFD